MTKQTTTQKLFNYISKFNGVTSIGLAAQDLNLTVETVRKHIGFAMKDVAATVGMAPHYRSLTV